MIKRTPYKPTPYGRVARFYKNLKSKNVFLAVMLLSAGAIFLPTWLTGQVQKVCQAWLAPGGRVALLAARKISPRAAAPVEPDGGLTDPQLRQMLAALSLQLQRLQHENKSLLNIRAALGPRPALVPARVVGFDSLGLPSIEIDRGTEAELEEGQPVLATIPLDVLRTRGLDPQLALAAGTLVGTVEYRPGPYTARVKLITGIRETDKIYGLVVRFVAGEGKTRVLTPYGIYLQGTAKGDKLKGRLDNATLQAINVPIDHGVQPGDFVIPRDPDRLKLPVPLVLGIVEKVVPQTDSSICVTLIIRPLFEKTSLNRVYVLSSHADSDHE
jgi:hypothetical protein